MGVVAWKRWHSCGAENLEQRTKATNDSWILTLSGNAVQRAVLAQQMALRDRVAADRQTDDPAIIESLSM